MKEDDTIELTENCAKCLSKALHSVYQNYHAEMPGNNAIREVALAWEECKKHCDQTNHKKTSLQEFVNVIRRNSYMCRADIDERFNLY